MSNWPPRAGCTGTTPAGCMATWVTFHPQSSKPSSTLRNGPTNPWSKSNSPSLHPNQCDSPGGQPRQAVDDIGQRQKSMGVRGDYQSVVGVAFGLLGFALGEGDVGARHQ